ncbi:class I SAM-dependent methyltransferase [Muriicola sp. E247]|uniref:class I SAM-dependent methyltransferase n=1 Tax=Muriicola sp. E247 TaxID=3242730 RepID=UPI003525E001
MGADVFGKAILDYQMGEKDGEIFTISSLGDEDSIPVSHLFRSYQAMPDLEKTALSLCSGRVLDVGCGAGSHSLHLTSRGLDVTSIDISPGAIQACKSRGLTDVVQADFWNYQGGKFDTLLLLMNGIGIVGQVSKLTQFFQKAKELLHPGGQIIFDSSDIIYMFDRDDDGGFWIPNDGTYYGELTYEMQYKNLKSKPFPWLFVDYNTLQGEALKAGFDCKLVRMGVHYDYLARLVLKA